MYDIYLKNRAFQYVSWLIMNIHPTIVFLNWRLQQNTNEKDFPSNLQLSSSLDTRADGVHFRSEIDTSLLGTMYVSQSGSWV